MGAGELSEMGKPEGTKRKKRGRPSLLDLQERRLQLQQLQQQQKTRNPNSKPNLYPRIPNSSSGRRNPNPEPLAVVHEEEDAEEEGFSGKRREKKLKLVHRIPDHSKYSPRHSGPSGSESEGEGSGSRRKRKIEAVGGHIKSERCSSLKATEPLQEGTSDSGPTTALPDKKKLLFILDRLQKKDSYGVFSEPVDPEELPDYHEVIEHPMDFCTVRKKLSRGAYKNLEQFEKDVSLISSNAMRYNAPDTIYYRQARSIQELAKKNFENLRQESDNEPETKAVVRRGRPPSKNIKQPVGQPLELCASDFSSDPKLSNADGETNLSKPSHTLSNKGLATEKPGSTEVSARASHALRNSELFGWISMKRVHASEEYSGSAKVISTKFGKKAQVMDENRRNTHRQLQRYTYEYELPILSLFDGEKNLLDAVGLHMEYAYARSLARFAAHIGPVGWAIAAKKIEKALPPGTKFGRGWVGDNEVPQRAQPPIHSGSPSYQLSRTMISSCTKIPKGSNESSGKLDLSCSDMSIDRKSTSLISAPASDGRSPGNRENNELKLQIQTTGTDTETVIQMKAPFQVHQNPGMQPVTNGFTGGFRFNLPSQAGSMMRAMKPLMSFCSEQPMTHARALEIVSRIQTHSSHFDAEKIKFTGTCNAPAQLRSSSMQAKLESIPPDLNVGFQSSGPPTSSAVVDSQQPDLALQL